MISVQERIFIRSCKEHVWDFTQDFSKRKLWDTSILDYEILQENPQKLIWVKMKGRTHSILKYKLYDKPHKTSLKMNQTKSFLIKGGGGSWSYQEKEGQTEWIQTNTIELKSTFVFFLFACLIRKMLRNSTINSMKKAKSLIEKEN